MKNEWKIILVTLCLIFALCACEKTDSTRGEGIEKGVLPIYGESEALNLVRKDMTSFDSALSPEYKTVKVSMPESINIGGLLVRESDILISDKASDSIVVTDYKGKVLKTVGKTGSDALEFLSPSRMTVYNDEIYIIDQDNFRVQVLSKDLEFVRSIPIKTADGLNPKFRKNHIAVGQQGVFLSNTDDTMVGTNRGIEYYPSDDGKYQYLATEFSGPIGIHDEKLYAINKMVSAPGNSENDGSIVAGPNWLFRYEKGDEYVQVVKEMPAGLVVSDMIIQEDKVIVFSASLGSLIHFDVEGNYVETLAQFEKWDDIGQFLSSDKNNSYWLVFPESHELYHIYKE